MKIEKNLLLLLLVTNSIMQAVTWQEYYLANKDSVDNALERCKFDLKCKLDLSSKNLTDLTGFDKEHIPGLPKIRELNLAYNKLTDLSHSIDDLISLEKLYVSFNQLDAVPETINNLTALEILDATHNKIEQFPTINSLIALKTLNLSDNRLTDIPDVSSQCNLERLQIYNNPIPGTSEDWAQKLNLNAKIKFLFKTKGQEDTELLLCDAIRAGNVSKTQRLFNRISTGLVRAPNSEKINISDIHDSNGSNLLEIMVQSYRNQLRQGNITDIDDRYMKIFHILLNCGDNECAQNMISPLVLHELLGLSPDNPLFKTIQNVLTEPMAIENNDENLKEMMNTSEENK